jgi:hypothetical protein
MTREEQIIILTNAQERAFKQIDLTEGCEMGSEDFVRLLGVAHQLGWMATPEETISCIVPDAPDPETPAEPDPSDEPEPEKPETGDDEEPAFKMEEVRAALAKARGRGVNVSEIIRSFGADNFQQIPKNQYGAIMAKLAEA